MATDMLTVKQNMMRQLQQWIKHIKPMSYYTADFTKLWTELVKQDRALHALHSDARQKALHNERWKWQRTNTGHGLFSRRCWHKGFPGKSRKNGRLLVIPCSGASDSALMLTICALQNVCIIIIIRQISRLYTVSQTCRLYSLTVWWTFSRYWHFWHTIVWTSLLLEQEAQLMLTTGSTRLAVSRGQKTWYHSTCYI